VAELELAERRSAGADWTQQTARGRRRVRNLFNIVMRIVSSLLGLLMIALGGIWILQGLDVAFRQGFMVNDKRWVAWGALLALFGLGQLIWSNTRQTRG
jgi:hypothetical protein